MLWAGVKDVIVPWAWPASTHPTKKVSMRLNTAAMTFRSLRSCGAISNAELTNMQPLRWRSFNERRRISSKNPAIASRGGKVSQRLMRSPMLFST